MATPLTRLIQRLRHGQSLTQRIGRATGWVSMGFGATNGLRLVSNLALTRLLSPEVFGLMALANVVMAGVKMFSDVGTSQSVIRSHRGEDEAFLQTAWTVQVIRGLIIAVITGILAWPAAQLYDEPVLFPLICVVALTALIDGLTSISRYTANRNLMMKRVIALSIINKATTVAVTIFAAWMLESVWALAIGGLFGSSFMVILWFLFLPRFNHRFRLEPEALRELVRFGRWILVSTAFTFLAGNGQQAIYGLLVDVEILGFIAIAILLAKLPALFCERILTAVIFPSFSEIWRNRPGDMARVMRKVRLMVVLGTFPVFVLTSYFAQPIIDLLYDDRYVLAGAFLALIPLNTAINTMNKPYNQMILSEGRSDLQALMTFFSAVLSILGMLAGFLMAGILGSFVGIGVGFALHLMITSAVATRRGYGTPGLDALALVGIGVVYVFVVTTLSAPETLWAPSSFGG